MKIHFLTPWPQHVTLMPYDEAVAMRYEDLFVRAGLDRNAGAVYGALLESGASGVAGICRATGLHRPSAYRALERLDESGLLVKERRGKRKAYAAADPSAFEALLERAREEDAAVLKHMGAAYAAEAGDASVRVYRGKDGLAAVLDDVVATLEAGGIFRRYSSRRPGADAETTMPADYRARRDRKRIEQFVITSQALRESPYRKRLECASKAVPSDEDPFDYGVNLLIYGDKVAHVDFENETAWVIENPHLARFHEAVFSLLYRKLKD